MQRTPTCTIIATTPNDVIQGLRHHRMPVIFIWEEVEAWMDLEYEAAHELLKPGPDDWIESILGANYVNTPGNEGPECIEPAE